NINMLVGKRRRGNATLQPLTHSSNMRFPGLLQVFPASFSDRTERSFSSGRTGSSNAVKSSTEPELVPVFRSREAATNVPKHQDAFQLRSSGDRGRDSSRVAPVCAQGDRIQQTVQGE